MTAMYLDDDRRTLQRRVADLEAKLRQEKQRADLLEQSARTAWRLSVTAPRPRPRDDERPGS
jgi:hypothetical protein